MTVLVWLVVPLLITALAAAWVAFAHRTRPPADPRDSMAEHQRFRAAMERPAPSLRTTGTGRPEAGEDLEAAPEAGAAERRGRAAG